MKMNENFIVAAFFNFSIPTDCFSHLDESNKFAANGLSNFAVRTAMLDCECEA